MLRLNMLRLRKLSATLLLLLLLTAPLAAQETKRSEPEKLDLDTIFSYYPKGIGPIQWQANGLGYYGLATSQNKPGSIDIVAYDLVSGNKTIFISAEKLIPAGATAQINIEQFSFSPDQQQILIFTNSERVWRSNTRGDYWVYDLKREQLHKLGGPAKPSTLMFAKFSPDSTRVGYMRDNNIYVESISPDNRGEITQITKDGARYLVNGSFDWVYEEELFCRDGWRWSPDSKQIAYWQLNTEGVKEFTLINNTAALYPRTTTFPYPKAGEMNSAARVGVISAKGGETRWFNIAGDPRNHYLPRMEWAGNSDEVIIQQLNREQNTNIVMMGDIRTGNTRVLFTETDAAWVDVSWGKIDWDSEGLARGDVEWLPDGQKFLWVSERDGWRHIYAFSRDGKENICITPGNFDVIGIEKVDKEKGWLYFYASPNNATQAYLYRVALQGNGKMEQLTPASQPGQHRYQIAPQGDLTIHSYSSFNQVPVHEVIRLSDHKQLRLITDNKELAEHLSKLQQCSSEFFRVDIGDGVQLDGWMIKPPNFDPAKRYPVLFYVYGEPWGQTVIDSWGAASMWHIMLAQYGYIIISVDNRGTPSPRGREWRKSIYRKMGVINSQDQANAARAISKWPFVDAERIGIWGWSGGGSSSLNAIFRYPDIYHMAMAVAPVPDIRYYDSIYQERYCGLPQAHPDEYKQSSPITFAKQLKGQLLIVHGTGDDNVHYQGTEELIDALIDANKQFTMMAYPNRSHGIYEGPNTTRHLFGLLTKFLTEKMPSGPRIN